MKVSVLGAGAVGSMLGGLIKHDDPTIDVLLIMRGPHGHAVHDRGHIEVVGPWGCHQVPVRMSFTADDLADSDYVLLTVKSQATLEAMHAARPFLGDATLISIQNGINTDALSEFMAPERLVLGMTATNIAVLTPGVVSLQLDGSTVIGPPPSATDFAATQRAARLLRKTGLQIEEHPNVRGVQYNKLAINALGYASCLSASNFITEGVCYAPWRHAVGRPIIDECVATLDLASIELAAIPGRPDVHKLSRFLRQLDWPLLGGAIGRFAKRIYDRKPIVFSLYQDLQRGKRTEVDFINGHIVSLAAKHGGRAPYNQLVCDLVHELEEREPASFFSREEVISRFLASAPRIKD